MRPIKPRFAELLALFCALALALARAEDDHASDEDSESAGDDGGSSLPFLLVGVAIVGYIASKALGSGGAKVAGGGAKGDSILLVGNTNSGKTVLMYRMVHGELVETVPSMKQTQVEVSCGAGEGATKAKVIDVPGHPRMRGLLPSFLPRAKAIVFVVDSSAVGDQVTAVAELLYEILTDEAVQAASPALLFACNKQDQRLAKAPEKICSMLEKEMTELQTTRASLEDTSNEGAAVLGRVGESFDFEQDAPCATSFVGCSALEAQLEPVMDFIRNQA